MIMVIDNSSRNMPEYNFNNNFLNKTLKSRQQVKVDYFK